MYDYHLFSFPNKYKMHVKTGSRNVEFPFCWCGCVGICGIRMICVSRSSPEVITMIKTRTWLWPQIQQILFCCCFFLPTMMPLCALKITGSSLIVPPTILLPPSFSLRADEPWYPGAGQFNRLHVSGKPPDSGRCHAHPPPLHPALPSRDATLILPPNQSPSWFGRLHPNGAPARLSQRGHHASGVRVQLAEVHPLLRF